MGKKKPQRSGRRLLGLQFKAITREELLCLSFTIMLHRSNASAAICFFALKMEK